MADITMCPGTCCPKKETCYRYWAPPSEEQLYFDPTLFRPELGECPMYRHRLKEEPNQ